MKAHTHRWNIEPQADGSLLICEGEHDKGAPCEWVKYAKAIDVDEAMRLLKDARQMIKALKVFGGDNVHRYDVEPFLACISAYLEGKR